MEGFQAFALMTLWIVVASSPLVFVGLTFLHAARLPQWVWAFSERTQVVWLALLLLGIAIVPLGLPVAAWYLMKVRPVLNNIEKGNLALVSANEGRPPDV